MTLSQLFYEYDANTIRIKDLRFSAQLNPTPENLQNLGAYLLWRESLRIQILRIYFQNL